MYKLLVCDDEKWIREGICTAIDWQSLGVTTILDARDGRRAVELVRSEKPDLVITDIRMPLFGGLEMIEAIREEVDPACIVVISGYSSFDYARTALKLGVADYLLKPIDETALLAAVRKCLSALAQRESRSQHQQSARLYHLSRWLDNEEATEEDIGDILRPMRVEPTNALRVLAVCCRLSPDAPTGTALPQLRSGEAEAAGSPLRTILLRKSATDFVCLFFSAALTPPDNGALPVEEVLARGLLGDRPPACTIGVGEWIGWRDAWISYRQSRLALSYRLLYPETAVHYYADIEHRKEKTTESFRSFQLSRPIAFLLGRDIAQYRKWLNEAFADMERHRDVLSAPELLDCFARFAQSAGTVWEIIDHPDYQIYCDAIALCWQREKLREMLAALPGMLHEDKHLRTKRHFTDALAYIGENFDQPLTMQEVAVSLGLSASYFSKMFSDCAGEPFLKYVSRLRMEKAKALLRDTGDKIYEVAEKVGYSDYRVFSKNFKDYTAMSPAEFRDRTN